MMLLRVVSRRYFISAMMLLRVVSRRYIISAMMLLRGDCCLMQTQQFFSYVIERTS
jgi:hypothetical protein